MIVKHEPDHKPNKPSTINGVAGNRTYNMKKRQIIFEDDKEVCKKIKNMTINSNMDIDEED
jgi:hypothetical protein